MSNQQQKDEFYILENLKFDKIETFSKKSLKDWLEEAKGKRSLMKIEMLNIDFLPENIKTSVAVVLDKVKKTNGAKEEDYWQIQSTNEKGFYKLLKDEDYTKEIVCNFKEKFGKKDSVLKKMVNGKGVFSFKDLESFTVEFLKENKPLIVSKETALLNGTLSDVLGQQNTSKMKNKNQSKNTLSR